MKKLKFRYAAAWNFLPFGPEGIEIFFDDYGQVVLVKGTNLDIGNNKNPASNGVGKSSIQDIISYALFGQTVKKPKKLGPGDVVNKTTGKGMRVEVQFDDYRIVRSRETSTNKVELWQSPNHLWDKTTKVSKGKGVQEQIDLVIGLSHTAFCNAVVFDDSNSYAFLELDAAGKRDVVENLLGLDRFRGYHASAKEDVKVQKSKIKEMEKEYQWLGQESQSANVRIAQIQQQEEGWRRTESDKVAVFKQKVKSLVDTLASCDSGSALTEYQAAQEQIETLAASINQLRAKRVKLVDALQKGKDQIDVLTDGLEVMNNDRHIQLADVRRHDTTLLETKKKIADLEQLKDGAKCSTCHGTVAKANYSTVMHHEKNVGQSAILSKGIAEKNLVLIEEKITARKSQIVKIKEYIIEGDRKLSTLDQRVQAETREMNRLSVLPKPEVGEKEHRLEADIVALKKQIVEKQKEIDGESPYKEILASAVVEKAAKAAQNEAKGKELKEAEDRLPYHEFWVEAFGDKGIRKQVVDGVIPALNSRIAYWLQFLIDSKIQLTFDNELKETITRNGVDAYYHAMSNGEKRRINLAVSQAFAYVMMLNSGHCPSLVFLDEITGGGIDAYGVHGIYNMIFELAKERQVFVTTHNQALLHMLQGCESLNLVKKGDITTLVT